MLPEPPYTPNNHPRRRATDLTLPPVPAKRNTSTPQVIEITRAIGGVLQQTEREIVNDFYRGLSPRDIQKKHCYSGLSVCEIAFIIRAHSEPKKRAA